jgi:hypothetical protein
MRSKIILVQLSLDGKQAITGRVSSLPSCFFLFTDQSYVGILNADIGPRSHLIPSVEGVTGD